SIFCLLIFFLFSFVFFTCSSTFFFYTLSLHDALPILMFRILLFCNLLFCFFVVAVIYCFVLFQWKNPIIQSNRQQSFIKIQLVLDRKSTRLNSSHVSITYAVFCLKKKKRLKIKIALL